jgi:hypothetical protein
MAAALDDIKPYAAAAGAVALFGTPAEVAVPIVRRLRRQSGVSMGPGLMNLANGVFAVGVARYFRQRPEQWQRWKHGRIPRWTRLAGLVYLTVSPAVAACWKGGVLFRRRTPLWGGLISPIGLLQITLLFVTLYRARRVQPSDVTRASGDDAGAHPSSC